MKHMRGVDPTQAESEAKPGKRHLLFDHPILTLVAALLLSIILGNVATVGIRMSGFVMEGETEKMVNSTIMTVSAFLVTLLYQLYFRRDFDGMLGWSTPALLFAIPTIPFILHNLFDADVMQFYFLKPDTKMNPLLYCLVLAIAPGVYEELMFRGVPASNWMRIAKDEGAVMKCVSLTSLVFGLFHGLNALGGSPISSTIFQVFYSTCIGFFFCTIFLRTGTMWPCIISHFLVDFCAFLFMDMEKGGIVTEELVIGPGFFLTLGLSLFLLLCSLVMLRSSKRKQILQLWHTKWSKADTVE